jgi:hypothetical protein
MVLGILFWADGREFWAARWRAEFGRQSLLRRRGDILPVPD